MKKTTAKFLIVFAMVLAILVPVAASPFLASQEELVPASSVSQGDIVAGAGQQEDEEVQLQAVEPAALAEPLAEPALITPASSENVVPASVIGQYKLFNFSWVLSAETTQTGSVASPVMATLSLGASLPTMESPVYKGVQVRVYFGSAAQYIDFSGLTSNLFTVNYQKYEGTLETDAVTGEPYLSYTLGDFAEIISGDLSLPIRFQNGITPNGTVVTPTARLYYVGTAADYADVPEVAVSTAVTGTSVLSEQNGNAYWSMANGANLSDSFNHEDKTVEVPGQYSLASQVNVSYKSNGSIGVLFAKSFALSTTLTLPADVSLPESSPGVIAPEAGFSWLIDGKNAFTDDSGVFAGTAYTKAAGAQPDTVVYTFTTVYTPAPAAGSNATAFAVETKFEKLLIENGATLSYSVVAATTATVTGVDNTTTATVAGTGSATLKITREPAVPDGFEQDSDLKANLRPVKSLPNNTVSGEATGAFDDGTQSYAYEDGDTVTYEIGGLTVSNPKEPDKEYTLKDFTITDYDFNDYRLLPTKVVLGTYKDKASQPIVPTQLYAWVGTTRYIYTLTEADKQSGEVALTDAWLQTVSGNNTLTLSQVTEISIYFGATFQSSFTVEKNPQFVFSVNAASAPADGGTRLNRAKFSFKNNPSWGEAGEDEKYTYTYTSAVADRTIQLVGNTNATIDAEKTLENISGRQGASATNIALGDKLRYTITIKNNTYIDRAINNLTIEDEMIGGLLKAESLVLKSISVSSPGWSDTKHDGYGTNANYTSLSGYNMVANPTTGGSPAQLPAQKVTWKFTGRNLLKNQTITLVYEVDVKTAEEVEAAGHESLLQNKPLIITNRVSVPTATGGGGSSGTVPSLDPRPFLHYGLSAKVDGEDASTAYFHTGKQETVEYTLTAKNMPNPYEGSTAVEKLVLGGVLPTGFELQTATGQFVLTRSGAALPAVTAETITPNAANGEVAHYQYKNGGNVAYELVIYKVTQDSKETYSFVLTINEELAAATDADTAQAFTLVFSAKTPTDLQYFSDNGYAPRKDFAVTIRMAVWDSKNGNLNTSSNYAGYRFSKLSGTNFEMSYPENDASWKSYLGADVKSSLQASISVEGVINQPVLWVNEAVARTAVNPSGYSDINYGVGDVAEHTFTINNQSIATYAPSQNSVIVRLPVGEELTDTDNITVTGGNGQSSGAVTVTPLTPLTPLTPSSEYVYYKISWENTLSIFAVRNSNNNYTAGKITVVYYTVVTAAAEDRFASEAAADFAVQSNAYLMFTSQEAATVRVYNSGKTAALDENVSSQFTYADSGDVDQNTATTFRLGTEYKHNFRRARVQPSIQKTVDPQPTALKDLMKLTVTLQAGNSSSATAALSNAYIIDILPKPLVYTGMASGDAPILTFETTYDFGDGNGAQPVTVLVWQKDKLAVGGSVTYKYNTQVKIQTPQKLDEYGVKLSQSFLLPSAESQAIFKVAGSPGERVQVEDQAGLVDNATQLLNALADYSSQAAFIGAYATLANTSINVQGDELPLLWQQASKATVGVEEAFSFKLFIQNGSMQENYANYKNMVAINRLPYVGDVGVVDGLPRKSEFQPYLNYTGSGNPISILQETEGTSLSFPVPQDKYTVWYLEVPTGQAFPTETYPLGHALWTEYWGADGSGKTSAYSNWKKAEDVTDWTQVAAFRIEWDKDYILSSRGRFIVDVSMKAPDSVAFDITNVNTYTAYNSFAFYALKNNTNNATFYGLNTAYQPGLVGVTLQDLANAKITVSKSIENLNGEEAAAAEEGRTFQIKLTNVNTGAESVELLQKNNSGVLTAEFANLPLGRYQLTEVAEVTGGLTTPVDSLYDVSITTGGTTTSGSSREIVIDTAQKLGQQVAVSIVNRQKAAELTIHKTTENGQPSAGITFRLVNEGLGVNTSVVTDGAGAASFANLPWGSYTLIEQAPYGTQPSGFTLLDDQSGAPSGYLFYGKTIELPAKQATEYSLSSTANVQNVSGTGTVVVHKTWNSRPKLNSDSMPEFYLLPINATDWSNAIPLSTFKDGDTASNTPATFTADNVASGAYFLYEIVDHKYELFTTWTMTNRWFARPGSSILFNEFRYNEVVIVEKDQTDNIRANNQTDETPKPPVVPPTTSSQAPSGSSGSSTGYSSSAASSGSSGSQAANSAGSSAGSSAAGSSSSTQTLVISDGDSPLAGVGGAWSLLNLICSVAAALVSLLLLVSFLFKKQSDSDDEELEESEKGGNFTSVLKVLVILAGILVGLLFIILSDFSQKMQLVDYWTRIVVPVFVVQLALLLALILFGRSKDGQEDEEPPQEPVA